MAGPGLGDGTRDGAPSLPSHLLEREVCASPHCPAPGLGEATGSVLWGRSASSRGGVEGMLEGGEALPSRPSPWQPPFYRVS